MNALLSNVLGVLAVHRRLGEYLRRLAIRRLGCSGPRLVVDDDQLGDPLLPEAEVEAQDQWVGQAGFVVGPVGTCVDGDVAVAIYGPHGREGDAVAEDLFRRESADRLGSGEFSLDIID